MGRRKKEPPGTHRENIATAAAQLFQEQGLTAATMDDIAKKAGYSKATIYVYFANKQEIISLLALKSMRQLYERLQQTLAANKHANMQEKYRLICQSLTEYQAEQPLYFQIVLSKINGAPLNGENGCPANLPDEQAAYQIGEDINGLLCECLQEGIASGELRANLPVMPTIFSLWGMLAGLIQLAAAKQEYISAALHQSREEFLAYGFEMLYQAIKK